MPVWQNDIIYYLGWPQFSHAVDLLVHKLADTHFDAIVGIARGGLVPATALANHLNIQSFYTIRIKHNASDGIWPERDTTRVAERSLSEPLGNKHILLVDDIAGDGETMLAARSHLEELGPLRAITTVTLVVNVASQYIPDLFIYKIDGWVVFPWERPQVMANPRIQRIQVSEIHMADNMLSSLR